MSTTEPTTRAYRDPDWLRSRYYGDKMSLNEMGEVAGVSGACIHKWMERHNIPRRTGRASQVLRDPGAGHYYTEDGYEAVCGPTEGPNLVLIHRLVAIANYGFDAVTGSKAHHQNGIRWDNRPENITLTKPGVTLRTDPEGYTRISADGETIRHHQLLAVAEHGIEAVKDADTVAHENRIPWDDRPDNLVVTDNYQQYQSKLSPTEAAEAAALYETTDLSHAAVGDRFGVSRETIRRAIKRVDDTDGDAE